MRKKSDKFVVTQQEIIEKTIDLIATKSLAFVSMREISKAAKVDTALLYYYFKNKEDLMYQTILYINNTMQNAIVGLDLDSCTSDEQKFKTLVRFVYDYLCLKINHASTMRQFSIIGHLFLSEELRDDALYKTTSNWRICNFLDNLSEKNETIKELGVVATLFCYMPIYDFVMHTFFPKTVTEKQIDIFINSLWSSINQKS